MKQQSFWDETIILNTYYNTHRRLTMATFAAECLPKIFTEDTEKFIDYHDLKVNNERLYSQDQNDKIILALRTFFETFKVKISTNGDTHETTPYIVKYFCEDGIPPSHQGFYIQMARGLTAYRLVIEKLAARAFVRWIKTYPDRGTNKEVKND